MNQPWLRASIKITKPIILIDMDGVICDFDKRAKELEIQGVKGHSLFRHPDAYRDLEPIEGAIEAWHLLQDKYETYILSTPPWSNPDAWSEKRIWVETHLGKSANKKLILCHHKGKRTSSQVERAVKQSDLKCICCALSDCHQVTACLYWPERYAS